MKLLLPLLFAAAALAQVPTHSVVGSLTMDVADIQVPVPYGAPEAHAAISLCTPDDLIQTLSLTVNIQSAGGDLHGYLQQMPVAKAGAVYCGTIVAPVERALLSSIYVEENRVAQFSAPPAAPAPAASYRRK